MDKVAFPVADTILRFVEPHLWVVAALVMLIAIAPVATFIVLEDAKALRWVGGTVLACLVAAPLCSAFSSGMYLARAARALAESPDADLSRVMPDIALGMDPMEQGPGSVLDRMARIVPSVPLLRVPTSDPEFSPLVRSVEQAFHSLSESVDKFPPDKRRFETSAGTVDVSAVSQFTELAVALQARSLVMAAMNTPGGSVSQPWRPISEGGLSGIHVAGPAGQGIVLSTNLLPPSSGQMPLVTPGLMANERAKVVQLAPDAIKETIRAIEKPPLSDLTPTDPLVEMWMNAVSAHQTVHEFLGAWLGIDAAKFLSRRGSDKGDLTLRLHNSRASYAKAVGQLTDVAGRGLYSGATNSIDVWSDEREYAKRTARFWLSTSADVYSGLLAAPQPDEGAPDAPPLKTLLSAPRDKGRAVVLTHELAHWALHAFLDERLGFRGLPRCLDEGLATVVDQGIESVLEKRAGEVNVAPVRVAEDWATIWRDGRSVTANLTDELVMSSEEFEARTSTSAGNLYADCYVATRLFGHYILSEALISGKPIPEVIAAGSLAHVPWDDVRSKIAAGFGGEDAKDLRGP